MRSLPATADKPSDGIEDRPFRTRLLHGMFWMGAGTFIGQGISWLSTIVVIRLLTPSDYGLMAMTTVFTNLLVTLGQMGIDSALIQTKELSHRTVRQIFGLLLVAGLAGVSVSYLVAPLAALFFREPSLIPLVRVLSLNLIVMVLYVVPQSQFGRELNFKARAQIELGAQLVAACVTLTCALMHLGVWSLVAGVMAAETSKAVLFNALRGQWVLPLFEFRGLTHMLKYGVTVTGDRLLNFVYGQVDAVVVGRFLGNATLGLYSVSMALASIPVDKVLPIVTQVSFASYARIQTDVDRIRANVLRSTGVVCLTGFPVFFGLSAVAPLAIPVLLGDNWESIVVPFQLICLILPLKALAPLLTPAIFATGRPMVNLVNKLITVVAMIAALLVGVRFGLTGVCLAWVAVYPAVFLISSWRSLRAIGVPLKEYLAQIRFPLFAAAAMLGVVKALAAVAPSVWPVFDLTMLVVAGILVYSGLVFAFNRRDYLEIQALLRR